MPRIPVPDDYPHPNVSVAGTADHNYGHADINLDDRRHERNLQIRRDDEGRYVGCGDDIADAVRDLLGVSEAPDDADGGDDSDDDVAEQIAAGDCPWCDSYDGDHVGRHASSAHPDEWAAYKDD